jgi:hypothetical protein
MFPLKGKKEDLKEKPWDPLSGLPPASALQTGEQKEPGTKKEPEETGTNDCGEVEPTLRKELGQCKKNIENVLIQCFFSRKFPWGQEQYCKCPSHKYRDRNFKNEMKPLLKNGLGLAEQLDQFLGPSVHIWADMSITNTLFTGKKGGML